jgi:hypothetical protein
MLVEVDLFTATRPLPARTVHARVGDAPDVVVTYHVPFVVHPVGSSIVMLGGFGFGFVSRLHGRSGSRASAARDASRDGVHDSWSASAKPSIDSGDLAAS